MSASLNNIVDVSVQISAASAISSDFNLGMIIGNSVQSLKGTVKIYNIGTYKTQMVTDGYTTSSPEYLAAQTYFSQSPRSSRIAIGNADSSKTAAQNFAMLREANGAFFSFGFCYEIDDSSIASVAAAVESSEIPSIFFYSTDDENCLVSSSSNVMATIKAAGYTKSVGFYSNDADIVPAIVGLVSALNSMADNSAYTACYKKLYGVTSENITDSQLEILSGYNGNAYCKFGSNYDFVYPGISAGGYHIDELYTISLAKHLIQNSVINGLVSSRKIELSESGVSEIISMISSVCNRMNAIGVITNGIWNGEKVGNLENGDAISGGYYIYANPIAELSAADRAARKSPTIYVALHSSGAIEHVVIQVYVDR